MIWKDDYMAWLLHKFILLLINQLHVASGFKMMLGAEGNAITCSVMVIDLLGLTPIITRLIIATSEKHAILK